MLSFFKREPAPFIRPRCFVPGTVKVRIGERQQNLFVFHKELLDGDPFVAVVATVAVHIRFDKELRILVGEADEMGDGDKEIVS